MILSSTFSKKKQEIRRKKNKIYREQEGKKRVGEFFFPRIYFFSFLFSFLPRHFYLLSRIVVIFLIMLVFGNNCDFHIRPTAMLPLKLLFTIETREHTIIRSLCFRRVMKFIDFLVYNLKTVSRNVIFRRRFSFSYIILYENCFPSLEWRIFVCLIF